MHEIRLMITKSHPVRTGKLIDGLDEETVEQLKKWQTPRKYYCMIQSVSTSKIDSHTIALKGGYINDYSKSEIIRADKIALFRSIMKYTHKRL